MIEVKMRSVGLRRWRQMLNNKNPNQEMWGKIYKNSPGLWPRACQTWFSMGTERAFLMYALSSPLVVYLSLSLPILLHLGFVLRRLAFKFLLRVLLRFAFASLSLCSCFALALLWICFCVPLALLSFCFRFAFALL